MIKDSIYMALMSIINYGQYIEGNTDCVKGKTDFTLLNAVYTGFLYTMLFEDYFDADNDTTVLIDDFVECLINMIATKTPNGYTFGTSGINLGYETKEKALGKIRNKIAHGDFYVRDGNIIFEEHGSKAVIDLNNFKTMVGTLSKYGAEYKKCAPNDRELYINKNTTVKPIDERNLDQVCKKIYQLKIIDKPTSLHVRNYQYIQAMHSLTKSIFDYVKNNPNLPIEKYKETFYKFASIYKKSIPIDVECSIKPIYELDEYEEIKTKFLYKNNYYIENKVPLSINFQIGALSDIAYGMKDENRVSIERGIILNTEIISELEKDPTLDKYGTIRKLKDKAVTIENNIEDLVITSYLIGFYAIFHYGLETSLTKSNERTLYEIYNGTKFDFGKLDVSSLESDNRVNEIPVPKLDYSKDKISKLGSLEVKLKGLEEGLQKAIEKNGEDSDKVINLKRKKEEALEEYQVESIKYISDLNSYLEFAKEFDYNKYVNNLDIIYHVRNAIAHGNVKVVSYGDDILDTVIRITDRTEGRKGNIVYDKVLTVGDFIYVFQVQNVILLHDFFALNINDEEKIIPSDLIKAIQRKI